MKERIRILLDKLGDALRFPVLNAPDAVDPDEYPLGVGA